MDSIQRFATEHFRLTGPAREQAITDALVLYAHPARALLQRCADGHQSFLLGLVERSTIDAATVAAAIAAPKHLRHVAHAVLTRASADMLVQATHLYLRAGPLPPTAKQAIQRIDASAESVDDPTPMYEGLSIHWDTDATHHAARQLGRHIDAWSGSRFTPAARRMMLRLGTPCPGEEKFFARFKLDSLAMYHRGIDQLFTLSHTRVRDIEAFGVSRTEFVFGVRQAEGDPTIVVADMSSDDLDSESFTLSTLHKHATLYRLGAGPWVSVRALPKLSPSLARVVAHLLNVEIDVLDDHLPCVARAQGEAIAHRLLPDGVQVVLGEPSPRRFDVRVEGLGSHKMKVIMVLKRICGLGSTQALKQVASLPFQASEHTTRKFALALAADLRAAGASVRLVATPPSSVP